MWDLIKEILTSPFGSFGAVAAVFGLLFWIAVKAGAIMEKYKVIDKIENNLETIKDDLDLRKNDRLTQSKSPISLSEKGKDVSKSLDAHKIVKASWNIIETEIKEQIRQQHDQNPYTVQEICFQIGRNYSKYFSPKHMDNIKTFAYEEGYNLSDFDIMFGVIIRDKYFNERNITISDIDKHDPNNRLK